MIELKKLSKRYPQNKEYTLEKLDFRFQDTGLYYIIGKSGSGKSTLLALLGGMDKEYEGSLQVNSKELKELSEEELYHYRFSMISFSFQDFKTDEKETVYEILYKTLAITSLTEDEIKKRIEGKLKLFGLERKKKSVFSSLSGGEKKRISLARALLKDAPILLVDEPLSSLNKRMREAISSILYAESKYRVVIVITHEKSEIQKDSTVLSLTNGHLKVEQRQNNNEGKIMKCSYQRIPFKGMRLFRFLLSGIKNKSEFLFVTLTSLSLSFFAITFSFLLSDGVKSSLSGSLSQYMQSNSMVVSSKDNGYLAESTENADFSFLLQMEKCYPDKVVQATEFYQDDIDEILDSGQSISVFLENRSLKIESLSVSSFLEPLYLQELFNTEVVYGKKDLMTNEVILGLRQTEMMSLYTLLYSRACPNLEEETLTKMSNDILKMNLGIRIQAHVASWSYHLDHSLTVVGIYLSNTSRILHSNLYFSQDFLKNVMYFKDYGLDEEIPSTQPWGLHKAFGLVLFPDQVGNFLIDFLKDKKADSYVLSPLRQKNHYRKEDSLSHNRFLVFTDCMTKVSISEIESLKSQEQGILSSRYSTPVYTYTSSGYIRGFTMPFFFSKYKEKLNRIQDNNIYSDENLGQFQSSAFELPLGVIKADLLSSSSSDGLRFITTEENTDSLVLGKEPKTTKEIAISTALAKELFSSEKKGIGEPLHVLTLEKTEPFENRYMNTFQDGELVISGIYQNDLIAIYQSGLFPLAYGIENLELSYSDFRVNQAILDVDLDLHDKDYYKKRISEIGDYQASFPMATILDEISLTMSRLSLLFLFFSILSLILASLLLGLSLFLILERDRKNIGVLLTLGYTKKEINSFYFCFCLFLVSIGYLMSLIITLVSQNAISNTLKETLNVYVFSVYPYLISLFIGIMIAILLSLLLFKKIKKLTPLEAFKSKK